MVGLDPAATTFKDTDALDPFILCVCRACTHDDRKKMADGLSYDWRHVVSVSSLLGIRSSEVAYNRWLT
jgi:hypothetical protein